MECHCEANTLSIYRTPHFWSHDNEKLFSLKLYTHYILLTYTHIHFRDDRDRSKHKITLFKSTDFLLLLTKLYDNVVFMREKQEQQTKQSQDHISFFPNLTIRPAYGRATTCFYDNKH